MRDQFAIVRNIEVINPTGEDLNPAIETADTLVYWRGPSRPASSLLDTIASELKDDYDEESRIEADRPLIVEEAVLRLIKRVPRFSVGRIALGVRWEEVDMRLLSGTTSSPPICFNEYK